MKILVTGAESAVGSAAVKLCPGRDLKAVAASSMAFDITNEKNTEDFIFSVMPECIIHCLEYKGRIRSEEDREQAFAVNAAGTENLAKAAEKIGAKLIFLSTDRVFEGDEERKIKPERDTNPLDTYGESKLLGEKAALKNCSRTFVVRTSSIYGRNEKNFIKSVLSLMREGKIIKTVSDVVSSYTYAEDLAVLLLEMTRSEKYGVYHGVNEGYCSSYDVALEIKRLCGYAVSVLPAVNLAGEGEGAHKKSRVLDTSCLKGKFKKLPPWQDALMRYLEDEGELI